MKIRTQFILYLVLLNCLSALALGYSFRQQEWYVWILLEFAVLGSLLIAFRLFRGFYEPLELLQTSAAMLREADFSTTLALTGQPDTDSVVTIYNSMLLSLRAERLRTEEKGFLLQSLITSSPTGILLCSERLHILSFNPAVVAMVGGLVPTSIGQSLDEVNTAFAEVVSNLAQGSSAIFVERFRRFKIRKDGFVERGIPHVLIMIEELTVELQSSEKLVYERIIRVLAHEINNSIGAARSLLDSALFYERYFAQETPSDIKGDFRDALVIANERLGDLGEFMREYAQLVRLPTPKRVPLDVGELLRAMAMLFRDTCNSKGIALYAEIPSEPITIEADKSQMQQVLTNLMKNAIEAIQEGAEANIVLSARQKEGTVSVTVQDSGIGLRNNAATELLTPFFTTKETGQGIGLMVVREIMKAHNFEFTLENRLPRGVKAEISIPLLNVIVHT